MVIIVFAPLRSALQCHGQGASVGDVRGPECHGGRVIHFSAEKTDLTIKLQTIAKIQQLYIYIE